MTTLNQFDMNYATALNLILDQAPSRNERTGKSVRAKAGMLFNVAPGQVPLLSLRDIKPMWTCAEAVWFMSGSSDAKWMAEFGFNTWNKFADAEGKVHSATGFRWRGNFESAKGTVDQLKNVVDKLQKDPSNRQAVLLSWDPTLDAVNPGPNAPCVMIWHFHIVGDFLHCSVLQRSADMYFGLPHDILGTHIVQALIAAKLRVKTGGLSYLVSNAHLYEDQWQAAETMLGRVRELGETYLLDPLWSKDRHNLKLTPVDFERAEYGNASLVHDLHRMLMQNYEPMPAISGPKLVL